METSAPIPNFASLGGALSNLAAMPDTYQFDECLVEEIPDDVN
jgi:hypothetical protein